MLKYLPAIKAGFFYPPGEVWHFEINQYRIENEKTVCMARGWFDRFIDSPDHPVHQLSSPTRKLGHTHDRRTHCCVD